MNKCERAGTERKKEIVMKEKLSDILEKVQKGDKRVIIYGIVGLVVILLSVILVVVNLSSHGKAKSAAVTEKQTEESLDGTEDSAKASNSETTLYEGESGTINENEKNDEQDPEENFGNSMAQGAEVDVNQFLSDNRNTTAEKAVGIDVSKYQGKINWNQVAASGIEFAMIRVGYRATVSGKICEDAYAAYNITNACSNNIHVGVYFFSSACSEEEAVQEAEWVINFIKKYNITYPVAYNCEGFHESGSRQYGYTSEQRSSFAAAFLNRIALEGYTPMFYASKNELENNNEWDTSKLSSMSRIWVAWYPDMPYPTTKEASYSGTHQMWQYTSNGIVNGISKPVDINVSYLGIAKSVAGTGQGSTEGVTISPEADMLFNDVNETVTAKIEVNLRNKPSQDTDAAIITTIKNGQTVTRTGISASGWSRVIYNGVTCYAVSSYLTTDLNSNNQSTTVPSNETSGNGIKTQFKNVNETVTAKIEVNLRSLPSVTDAEVVAKIVNGDKVVRTGISEETGWSRVVYNGQTLYCVSSYLEVVE